MSAQGGQIGLAAGHPCIRAAPVSLRGRPRTAPRRSPPATSCPTAPSVRAGCRSDPASRPPSRRPVCGHLEGGDLPPLGDDQGVAGTRERDRVVTPELLRCKHDIVRHETMGIHEVGCLLAACSPLAEVVPVDLSAHDLLLWLSAHLWRDKPNCTNPGRTVPTLARFPPRMVQGGGSQLFSQVCLSTAPGRCAGSGLSLPDR